MTPPIDGYHVFSYLVPEGVSPGSVNFKTGHASKWFGYIAYGAYYGAVNTAESTGQIVALPSQFTWTRLTPKDLFPNGEKSATWEGGIACADTHGHGDRLLELADRLHRQHVGPEGLHLEGRRPAGPGPVAQVAVDRGGADRAVGGLAALAVFLTPPRPSVGRDRPRGPVTSPLSGEPGEIPRLDRRAPEPSAAGR